MEARHVARSGRKSYTCTPCRSRKIRCDRYRVCSQCSTKGLTCVWPSNGEPLEQAAQAGPSRAAPSPALSHRPHVARPQRSLAPLAELPLSVALAEQFDHSILNDTKVDGRSTAMPRRQRRHRFPFDSQRIPEEMDELLANVPSKTIGDALLKTYLERVEWIHHPLHLPTFLSQYNRQYSMDANEKKRVIEPRWLALFYIVLCLGSHFGASDADQEAHLLESCEACLSMSDFTHEPSLEAIQTIICLNLYYNNNDRTTQARSFLGIAIRLALSLGLSRIPDDHVGSHDALSTGVIDREMGRRLWWSLVCQDAYTASTNGLTYSIQLRHSTTGLFADVDDEAIGTVPVEGKATSSTYHLAKIDHALVVRDFIDAVNEDFPNASYNAILDLDHRFRRVHQDLPNCLRYDIVQPFDIALIGQKRYLYEQRIFLGITLHNRIIRLHRAYMSRGYQDTTYRCSVDCCIASATVLLDLAKQCRDTLCHWWVVLVHIWTAGLVLGSDLVRGDHSEDTRRRREDGVRAAIELLEPMQLTSPVALRGLRVLQSILDSRSRGDNSWAYPMPDGSLWRPTQNAIASDTRGLGVDSSSQDQAVHNPVTLESLFELNFEDLASLQLPADFMESTWPHLDNT